MSYEYLKRENVIPVPLSKVVGRIRERIVELSPKDEERAMRLHQEGIVIDFHNHPIVLPEDPHDFDAYARSGRPATGYEGLKRSGMTACLSAFGGPPGRRSSPIPWQFDDIIWDLGMRQADMDHHQDVVMRGHSVKDILEAQRSRKVAVFSLIENAGVIGNDIDRLDVLYGFGVRCLGLTYNNRTTIGDGVTERADGGLSSFGFKVIERMNRLGMLIDFSHSSELSTKEGVEASETPCACTHNWARGVYTTPKGKSDETLDLIAKHGGAIGVAAIPNVISDKEIQTVFDIMDHVDYIVKRVGVDHVAIGTDSIFGDHVGLHRVALKLMDLVAAERNYSASHIEYMENPGQLPNVTRALVARGYPDEDIKKIMGGNVLRLLGQTIG